MTTEKQEVVVKSNKLVEASYRLGLVEQQLVLYAICLAREEQKGLSPSSTISIEARAFAEKFKVDARLVYSQLKDASNSLFARQVIIHDIHPKSGKPRVVKTRWVSDIAYVDGEGIVELTFAPKMVPYITRLEAEFTSYRLEKIGNMSSAHAVRLYELLAQYLAVGRREIELDEFKEMLGIPGEYKAIKDLKKRVIEPAMQQINEYSDIAVSFEQRKTGRAVTHLIFAVKQRHEAKPAKPVRSAKHPAVTREYVEQHARPGESYDQAFRRLLEESGQQRLMD